MKTKLLPLLLVAPLIASCGMNHNIGEAKFEPYSNKVEFAAFSEELMKARAASFVGAESLESISIKSFEDKYEEHKIKRGDKEIANYSQFSSNESDGGYDKNNHILYSTGKMDGFTLNKAGDSEVSTVVSQDLAQAIQETVVNEVNTLIMVSEKQGIYREMYPVSEMVNLERILKVSMIGILPNTISAWEDYNDYDDAEKARFSFYQDEKVFTVVYGGEFDVEDFEVDSDNNPAAKAHIKAEEKFQVVCKDDVYRVSHQYKFEYKIEVLKSTTAFDKDLLKGDVMESLKEGAAQNEIAKGYEHAQLDLANFVEGMY